MTDGAEKLLTFTEVAARLGVSHTTVSKWVRDGAIRARRLPNSTRRVITEVEFRRFWDAYFSESSATSATSET